LAKIADELDRALTQRTVHGAAGRTRGRQLARGDGWAVEDVICTSGPDDRPFEEQHSQVSIAIVAAGTFQYRATTGRALMTPGSLLLGNAGHCFECGHEHGRGDRCIAFRFSPDYFERIAADVGVSTRSLAFSVPRLPAIRDSAAIVADACSGLVGSPDVSWEEIGVRLAACAARIATGGRRRPNDWTPSAAARVTRVVRAIECLPASGLSLTYLAQLAGLSPYHFLRTFERLTGLTPHQYVRRSRLREAAMRLVTTRSKVIDVAFSSGFGDVSNFNRAFRAEFGVSPRAHRARAVGMVTPTARLRCE
jgi:AraC-like DNA-binding protein